ncbi:hypothetical protein [Burkholderia sp. Ax-1719]|uniref:hypothetical protein n=1 Tax=Burkholderia sp. Ax-1719 TaxID=2608334 RepID=UPI0014211AAB|nr:hypothetical protein [Burkholderia sp. Ax-1719]NIE66859.1 hypothetical protein [Burkholderia sp. Ax-1719]
MLEFKDDDVYWNGVRVHSLKLKEMSPLDRFEFLCAISCHDPFDELCMHKSMKTGQRTDCRN